MMINDNIENLRWKSYFCHKLVSDGGALVMMCGRDEEFGPSVIAHWRIVMAYTHYKAMDTHCQ